ncbi:hypothetical protein NDU88_004222 [Pleurodeles waltl]|uniref:Uncharacterized protein n=1 Tax=Pleurodeles waltl TaxID=8319 RepID=A0AAV7V2F7_PLEWA|nr:hypothetical protein NDU88_004222 [Pleurodeles waltl]
MRRNADRERGLSVGSARNTREHESALGFVLSRRDSEVEAPHRPAAVTLVSGHLGPEGAERKLGKPGRKWVQSAHMPPDYTEQGKGAARRGEVQGHGVYPVGADTAGSRLVQLVPTVFILCASSASALPPLFLEAILENP